MIGRLRVFVKDLLCRFVCIIESCDDCGIKQPLVWHAEDALWMKVTGITDGGGCFCPSCFDRRAEAFKIYLRWRPEEDKN